MTIIITSILDTEAVRISQASVLKEPIVYSVTKPVIGVPIKHMLCGLYLNYYTFTNHNRHNELHLFINVFYILDRHTQSMYIYLIY